jgi:hypothetical protein
MVRQYAPTLAESNPDFRFDADTNRNGLASDAKSGSKNRKVFTYKYERVRALGSGRFVNKGWRPQDRETLGELACFSGLRAMNIDWIEDGKGRSGSLTPYSDFFFAIQGR